MSSSCAANEGEMPCAGVLAPFEQVYHEHAASVHRFCLSQMRDPALAEDMTHDIFMRALLAYERVRPDTDSARPWLFSIARNCMVDEHRRRGRARRLVARLGALARREGDVEAVADDRSELQRVNDAMASLGRRDRQLIGLRVAAGLSYREVGAVLGISESVAKVATYRALTRLRSRLEGER